MTGKGGFFLDMTYDDPYNLKLRATSSSGNGCGVVSGPFRAVKVSTLYHSSLWLFLLRYR